jgi:hypothetical protein
MKHSLSGMAIVTAITIAAPALAQRTGAPVRVHRRAPALASIPLGARVPPLRFPTCRPALPGFPAQHLGGLLLGRRITGRLHPIITTPRLPWVIMHHRPPTTMGRQRGEKVRLGCRRT